MRPQHNNNNNKNRNRNRNRHRSGGSQGGGGGGGSGANRVYDSNGPDVKLRGTAQTIAEKYMQLGRDAQSSGDTVMAESYYQFGDHYYRLWLANQPAGQPLQFSRRMAEEEYEDEGGDQPGDGEGNDGGDGDGQDTGSEGGEGHSAEGPSADVQGEGQQQTYQPRNNNNRDYNNNNNNRDNREGGNRFKQRWPRRNDRYNQEGAADTNGNVAANPGAEQQGQQGGERTERYERNDRYDRNEQRTERVERPVVEERVAAPAAPVAEVAEAANWEAPSFLKRPTPVFAAEVSEGAVVVDAAPPKRRGRPPKVHAAPVEDVPQGE